MLHILLLILKIIGIILLVILGLILTLIAIVLFVPLRYRVSESGAGDLKSLQGRVKFSWLLHLVSGYACYENQKLDWNVRVAWKWIGEKESAEQSVESESPDLDTAAEEKKEVDSHHSNQIVSQEQTENLSQTTSENMVVAQEIETVLEDEIPIEEETVEDEIPLDEESVEDAIPIDEAPTEEKVPLEEKIEGVFRKIQAFFEKIKYTFDQICDNIKALTATKDRLEAFITDDVHQAALSRAIKELKRLLRFLKPKRFYMDAHIGFKDPSVTGKLLAALSILYPFVGKNHLCVEPEFEDEVYEGRIDIRGHVRVIYLVIIGWNLIWDKNIRMTYKHIKNLKK